ncbi:hypothetical protein COY52_05690 [Candidatus Desantisbacteria bacterium CG_4_10_14_0_8_um_filter_48_22]|uniref:Uncharacterized protein n=1 Tax=Candidatus Desantisbacteria bacterium CG_4_10_14_0_8_um_filter_48_22 TaxID=1974543 RepID=A0A2M7SBP4_9BACT|nr:MAG: hypothetical protein AUJ67_06040 [Candidatus Desantisbacteria bacterium CG1_02_49_89]PIV56092.1 MAG: hypothetical protein COS16_05015 [Candidatus Desantisbacteria bacterium CG02_land_8_20_14_3_00_49_13]PIZ16918.1 MAG: hypothetical protein COY52_05690 [Candidatus Desantisbacteria bacterium CG_4_10_14_0_8_um_filter_48_22]
MYEERIYRRDYITEDLKGFEVMVKESDLYICAASDLSSEAIESTLKYRSQIEEYIKKHPQFLSSLTPLPIDVLAAPIVNEMLRAGETAGTGPMAAVAGAIAEYVGRDLLKYSPEVIVENGGDIFLKSLKNRRLGIHAGNSPLSERITVEIEAKQTPVGVCTSSGTVGPSLSFGRTDAALVVASSAALADACATAIGNIVKEPGDIKRALEFGKKAKGVRGVLIIMKDKLGAWGAIKIV